VIREPSIWVLTEIPILNYMKEMKLYITCRQQINFPGTPDDIGLSIAFLLNCFFFLKKLTYYRIHLIVALCGLAIKLALTKMGKNILFLSLLLG